MTNQDIILAPIISEKSMKDAGLSKFTFKVLISSNKSEIKKAVEEKFKVNVLKVITTIVKGRSVRAGKRRSEIARSPWKKAVVGLKKGQKISLFEIGVKK